MTEKPDYTADEQVELHRLLGSNSTKPAGENAHFALRHRAIFEMRCELVEAMRDLERGEHTGRSLRRDRLYERKHGREKAAYDFARGNSGTIKPISKHDAGEVLNRFLTVAAIVWYQTTGKEQKPNSSEQGQPTNDYSRFIRLATSPLIGAICAHYGEGLVPRDWPAIKQRIERADLRSEDLLQPRSQNVP
ncbi:MAG: hypothetical protein AAF318_19965 [Pseudomonadota bacterium]